MSCYLITCKTSQVGDNDNVSEPWGLFGCGIPTGDEASDIFALQINSCAKENEFKEICIG